MRFKNLTLELFNVYFLGLAGDAVTKMSSVRFRKGG